MERGIGQLKRRFFVLHDEIRLTPPLKVAQIVDVCALLHNICKERNIQLPPEDNAEGAAGYGGRAVAGVPDALPAVRGRRPGEGGQYRDEFCKLHFSNRTMIRNE